MKKVTKYNRILPAPFVVIMLSAVLSVLTTLANGGSLTRNQVNGAENSLQMQSIEQERMATMYFRVMSWLSSVKTQPDQAAKTDAPVAPVPRVMSPVRPILDAGLRPSIRLCAMRTGQRYVVMTRPRSTLN